MENDENKKNRVPFALKTHAFPFDVRGQELYL